MLREYKVCNYFEEYNDDDAEDDEQEQTADDRSDQKKSSASQPTHKSAKNIENKSKKSDGRKSMKSDLSISKSSIKKQETLKNIDEKPQEVLLMQPQFPDRDQN